MFTGIIEQTGIIRKIIQIDGDIRLTIHSENIDFSDVKVGDSIASNGICLTVIDLNTSDYTYTVDVSCETLSNTAMHLWQIGDTVNLEKAMLPTTRFGGHIVSGHVDCVGSITLIKKDARSVYVEVQIPDEYKYYTATKGSVTVDGISLTTNLVKDNIFCLNVIPHTAKITNIGQHWEVGRLVNVEIDVVAKYLERLLLKQNNHQQNSKSKITEDFLTMNGFMK